MQTSNFLNLNVPKLAASNHTAGTVLTNRDLEIVRAEMAKGQFQLSGRDKMISWMVLMILLLA